jgi:hypothetical protein
MNLKNVGWKGALIKIVGIYMNFGLSLEKLFEFIQKS